ncbi:MAG: hypothetical protein AB8B65_05570 [Kordia sp.]|uniref:hypothetical protein n=1 Tax=Kordia sp. TaxID=1965332 RepID=UPI00385DCB26
MDTKFITITDKQSVVHSISVSQIVKITDLVSESAISLSDNSEISTPLRRTQILALI